METATSKFSAITKSKFLRSIFFRVLSIFLIVSIAIVFIVFFFFSSELNKNIISDRQKQLAVVENTISSRMEEISSIAYSINNDSTFYLNPMDDPKYSGLEMSNILSRYLVGNGFIEHLAYYRLSEPDKIFTSSGELSFSAFWQTYLKLDEKTSREYIKNIQSVREVQIVPLNFGSKENSFFAYLYPLPQFSKNPQAFVLMLIRLSEVAPIIESQLTNYPGEVAVFDSNGSLIYEMSTLNEGLSLDLTIDDANSTDSSVDGETYMTANGRKYVIQKQVSQSNGWTYLSAIQLGDTISGLANTQLLFIILLIVLLFAAISTMLIIVIIQYKPISNLAEAVTYKSPVLQKNNLVDEGSILSDTFTSLENANKAKSAFLSNMSHDIRTPMNAIIGMTSIAYKHSDDASYVRECLQKVQIASQYLLDIINNVLDMSKIESGRFIISKESVDLPKLVHGLTTIISQSIKDKHQQLYIEIEDIKNEKVICDNLRLSQVFMNILTNSIKFTPEGGEISLYMVETDSQEDGYSDYIFKFSDTGMGMPAEFIEHVFDTFSRSKDANISKVEGTGLGMSIAKSLVEIMGGTISCESRFGSGTTFTVSMHLQIDINQTVPVEAQFKEKDLDTAVLIMGKDKRLCANQIKGFAAFGIQPAYAWDPCSYAVAAREMKEENKSHNLVIINQSNEDKNGLIALSEVYKTLPHENTTYVLAMNDTSDVNQSEANNAGINFFAQIPLFRSTIIRMLSRTLNNHYFSKPSPETIPDLSGVRILMVEDNDLNREIAYKIIGETNAEIIEAVNGREAVDIFASHGAGYFNIILMDLQMPVMNGYEATTAIRSMTREDAHTIPIFAMTANTFDEDVRQVKDSGMNGHISKPYTPEELYIILKKTVGRG